jgi:multidrug efflux pump subunit AcrA (membrane-fusion protein)
MKIRVITIFLLVFFRLVSVIAQNDVNNDELEGHLAPVEFINNESIPARIDTRLQIWQIGNSLGLAVKNGAVNTGQMGRYFVIHCGDDESGKLTADIFGLGPDAGVDHIRNLRTILQGYLEGAYDYSAQDAALIARYITIYNAVFRGNMEYMAMRYNEGVINNLVPESVGLDAVYSQWAGKTLMLIPIGDGRAGSLSAVNTTPLTEPEVIDEMRKEGDKGVPERKDMVELKEREAEEAEKKAMEQSQTADEEQAAITEEKKQVEQERKQLAEEKAGADTEKQQEIAQKEEELDQKEQELARREEAASAQKEEAQKNQELAENKTAEAQQERKDIAADQQQMITDESDDLTKPFFVLGIILNDSSSFLGSIVRIDAGADGKTPQTTELTTVNVRTINIIDGFIYALAPQGDGSYRLVKIEEDSLSVVGQGTDAISANSLLWVKDSDIYALVSTGAASSYLGLFDKDLQLKAQSATTVHPFASALFNKNVVVTQRSDGQTLFLNPRDLTEVDMRDVK